MLRILFPDAHFGRLDCEQAVAGAEVALDAYNESDAANLPDAVLAACDAVVAYHLITLDAAMIARLRRCRIIVRAGVGFDNVDLTAAGARGIAVCNVPDYGTTDVADHAIALLLALARGIPTYDALLRQDPVGGWRWQAAPPPQRRLRGARFGVVGLGRIGTAAARRAAGLDMHVAFHDPYLPPGHELATNFERFDRLEDLLGTCDVVSLHAPLTPETRNIIDAAAVAHLKPGAILINTARGGMVDLDAVYEGLKSGRLGAAGLDVTPTEPPDPASRLIAAYAAGEGWLAGRLILTPHAAFYSPESLVDLRTKSVETALLYLREGRLRSCVNRHLLTDRPDDPTAGP